MTVYCKTGEKVKIYITFNQTPRQVVEPDFSPVEVIVEDFTEHTSNYLPQGYQLSCYSTNNERGYVFAVRDYKIVDLGSDYEFRFRFQLWVQFCDSDKLVLHFNVDPSSIVIDSSITCVAVETNKQKSKVHIRQVGASIDVFTLVGDSPCKIEVACGDNCPEGYCKIDCETYPGYCCIDEALIQSLSNQLNSNS